ncbi:MAG: hypothetical protein R3B45_16930 [Bdellovibrionota bacterium]
MKKSLQISTPKKVDAPIEDIVEFLENYRELIAEKDLVGSKLISIKIPIVLLEAFRFKADQENIPYQTKIKELMKNWVIENT